MHLIRAKQNGLCGVKMSKLKGKNVFITGATGIVGYWLTTHLYDIGADVTIYMRDFVPKSNLIGSSIFLNILPLISMHSDLENLLLQVTLVLPLLEASSHCLK